MSLFVLNIYADSPFQIDRKLIVEFHDAARRNVNPTAKNMRKMVFYL